MTIQPNDKMPKIDMEKVNVILEMAKILKDRYKNATK